MKSKSRFMLIESNCENNLYMYDKSSSDDVIVIVLSFYDDD